MFIKTLGATLAIFLVLGLAKADYDVSKYCELVQAGTKLASLSSCSTFYVCSNQGQYTQGICPQGQVFSKDAQGCVDQADSSCGTGNPCINKNDTFVAASLGCTSMWHYCFNGQITETASCPLNEIFSSSQVACVYGKCGITPSTDQSGDDVQNMCEIIPNGQYFGDFQNCTLWHLCTDSGMQSGNCLNGLVYDAGSGMCLQNNGNMCQRTSAGNGGMLTTASGPPSVACNSTNQIVSDTNICSIYYTCVATTTPGTPNTTYSWQTVYCPYQEYFDVLQLTCQSPTAASPYPGCNRCQYESGVSATQTYWVNAVDSTCDTYYTCINGQITNDPENNCGPNNYYNEDSQYCIVGNATLASYSQTHGACKNYSCNATTRVCTAGN